MRKRIITVMSFQWLAVIVLVALLARGWIRQTAFPSIAPTFADHSVNAAIRKSKESLQTAEIMTKGDVTSDQRMSCSLNRASGCISCLPTARSRVRSA